MKIPLRMHALKSDDVKDFLDHITNELDDPQVPVEVSVANLRRKLLEISKRAIPSKILFTQKGKKNLNLYNALVSTKAVDCQKRS